MNVANASTNPLFVERAVRMYNYARKWSVRGACDVTDKATPASIHAQPAPTQYIVQLNYLSRVYFYLETH